MTEPDTAAPATDETAPAAAAGARTTDGVLAPAVLAASSLAWLAATLWAAHGAVIGAPDASLGLTNAALALPSVVSASLVAGAGTALVTVRRLRRWRAAVGAAVGLAVGGVAGGLVVFAYGRATPLVALGVAIAVAAVVGGALCGVRPLPVLGAGLAGVLAWFGVGLVESLFSGQLREWFAANASVAAQAQAAGRLSLAVALVGGVVAGLCAYAYLRRRDRGLRWPAYLAAGATPGLLLLATDAASRIGGAPLLRLAGSGSAIDQAALSYVATARLNTALVVLFTGAVTAILAHGRTLTTA
jgi:hypothetical protein